MCNHSNRCFLIHVRWPGTENDEERLWQVNEPMRLSPRVANIDYRCEDGRFPVSASCVSISKPDLLSSSETGVNSGIRSWKKHLSDWARCQKAIGGIYFTKKWRAETLQRGLEFDNFKPRLKSGIFKCISWLNGSSLGGNDLGFLKEGVKTYQMAPMSPLNSQLFLCLHTYTVVYVSNF
jgi:hypothetical protein